jgi:regulator of protease activity HflC (stomatin/prohibitin superfamily)
MRIFRIAALVLLSAFALGACAKIPAGHVGIKVALYGDDKGVQVQELPPGRYFNGISHEFYKFPTFTQNASWESEGGDIQFQTREGMTIDVNLGIKYHLDPTMITQIFQTYRKGVEEITDVDVRNIVRNSLNRHASRYTIREIYGDRKNEFLDQVIADVKSQTEPNGIVVEEIFVIGTFYLPDQVYASIEATQKAEQDALQRTNEVQTSIAEAQKLIEEAKGQAEAVRLRAEAEANANIEIAQSITAELIDYYRVQAWDGAMPRVTGSEGLIIDLSGQDLTR